MKKAFYLYSFVLFAFLFARCASTFPNVDEVAHLPAGVSHLHFGRFELYRVNPPLARTVTALVSKPSNIYDWTLYSTGIGERPEFVIGRACLLERRLNVVSLYFWPRIIALCFWIIGLIAVLGFGKYLEANCSVFMGAYWISSPSILSNSPSICPDLASVAIGLLTVFAAWRYVLRPQCGSVMLAGFVFGLALLTKLTWLTAVAILPVTVFLCLLVMGKQLPSRLKLSRLGDLVLFWSVGLLTLNGGYLFEDSFVPLRNFEFCSEALGGQGCNARVHGNRFENTWLANVPVPVPKNYLLGIDYLKYEVENKMWSFLDGEWKFGSWPHYYIMTTLYKTPEPTLLGALIGLGVLITGIRRGMVKPEVISMFLFLIIPAAVCFASVSLQGGFNHHHRYVLMIYPPMFALAAYIASPVGVKLLRFRFPFLGRKRRSIAMPLAITLVTLSAASTLRVHPYYTSYFNTLSGGPENGWHRLGFSNIDWGQDILEVDQWLKKYPERRPLVMDIDYFGMNGDLFDVPTSLPPVLPLGASVNEVRRSITETQWWIISVKKLYNLPDQPGLQYLQQLEPVERIAYAYHVYRIDPLPSEESSSPDEPTP